MVAETEVPKTIYGLIARKHNTTSEYVGDVVTGVRKAAWGKGVKILEDWNKIKESFDDWMTEFKADGTMIVNMEDIHVSVYVQGGIARVYKKADLKTEVDVKAMKLEDFRDFLNGVRMEFN